MRQQINLYQYLPHPIKSFIDLKVLVRFNLSLFAVLMMISFCSFLHERYLTYRFNQVNAQLAKAQATLQQEVSEFPQLNSSQLAMNASKIASCKMKFSPYLVDFARAIQPGIWLTEFSITQNGHQVVLKGLATRGFAVQVFLEQLNKMAAFLQMPFTLEDLSQQDTPDPKQNPSATTSRLLRFTLLAGANA